MYLSWARTSFCNSHHTLAHVKRLAVGGLQLDDIQRNTRSIRESLQDGGRELALAGVVTKAPLCLKRWQRHVPHSEL